MSAPFEADLCPETGAPRMRFNFANGWSGSIVLVDRSANGCDAFSASVACSPSGEWGTGQTALGPRYASPEEALAWLSNVSTREAAT